MGVFRKIFHIASPVKTLVIITKHPEACIPQWVPFLHMGSPRDTALSPELLARLPEYLDPFRNSFQNVHGWSECFTVPLHPII